MHMMWIFEQVGGTVTAISAEHVAAAAMCATAACLFKWLVGNCIVTRAMYDVAWREPL
jgi:hypothetical protein